MSYKVLVIEATHINLILLIMHLKRQGYDVQGAENGKEGLRMAKVMSFDLILCDVKLSDIDGEKLIVAMKAEERLEKVPILVMSTIPIEDIKIDESLIAGYLLKPVQPGIIIKKIEALLPERKPEDQIKEKQDKIDEIEKRAEQRKQGIKVIDGFTVETISIDEVKVGMETGDQINDNNHSPIIPKGIALTEKHIDKLKSLDIKEIIIRK